MSLCRTCRAHIVYAASQSGGIIAIDAEPNSQGSLIIETSPVGQRVAVAAPIGHTGHRWSPHSSTCKKPAPASRVKRSR